MAHEVFISYPSQDKAIADAACARLESRGIRCWIAPRDVPPGMSWREALITAIRRSRVLVLVFSSHSNLSKDVEIEVGAAVSHGIPVVPLRIEDVEPQGALDYLISSVHWLDALTPPIEDHLGRLADSVERLLGEKAPPPRPGPPVPPPGAPPRPRRNLLFIGAGLGLAGVLLFRFWPASLRDRAPAAPAAAAITQPAPSSPPERLAPTTAPATPTSDAARDGKAQRSRAAASTSLAGCWVWLNGVQLRMSNDGRVTGTPFQATWKALDGRRYQLAWPVPEASVLMSEDGRSLTGVDTYGTRISARRSGEGPAPLQSLTGVWNWNGGTAVALDDGTISTAAFRGSWRSAGGRSFTVAWPTAAPLDELTLSDDGAKVSGANQYGIKVGGSRMACD